jgi:hypothetical protein
MRSTDEIRSIGRQVTGNARMRLKRFSVGDWVLYRKLKHSASPGRRASDISRALHGDGYNYFVVKFWTVQEVLPDGRLKLRTRKGKTHLIDASDPNLRRVTWWMRWIYKNRFRVVEAPTSRGP